MWNLSSGTAPWLVFALVSQKPSAFCFSSIISPRASATSIGYIWDPFLCGAFEDVTNHPEILWFKTTTIHLVHSSVDWMGIAGLTRVCGQPGGPASEVWLAAGWGNGRWLGRRALIAQQAGSQGGLARSQEKECNISWGIGLKLAQYHFHCSLLTKSYGAVETDKIKKWMIDGRTEKSHCKQMWIWGGEHWARFHRQSTQSSCFWEQAAPTTLKYKPTFVVCTENKLLFLKG